MMKDFLPKKIDLKTLCHNHAELEGKLLLTEFPRLQQLIADFALTDQQKLWLKGEAKLSFSLGDKHQHLIRGRVKMDLPARCQRCLELFPLALEIPIQLIQWSSPLPARDELLLEDFDWLVYEEEVISLANLLEDDLLLAFPVAPSHEVGQCDAEMLKELALRDIPEPIKQVESSQFFQALSLLKQQESKQKKPKE